MELEQDGNSISIDLGRQTFIGRELGLGLGSSSSDRTISRRHVSLQFLDTMDDMVDTDEPAREFLSFEVIGKNPILVISNDGDRKRVYKKSEKGVLKAGDGISLSVKNPNFFLIKRKEGKKEEVERSVFDAVARRERRTRQRRNEAEERAKLEEAGGEGDEVVWEGSGLGIGSLDISKIDPVKEFGFLVRGHEFDHYPRRKIRPFKDWNWFLEDNQSESSEDEEEDEAVGAKLKGKGKRQKRKKGGNSDDEDWTEDSEGENNLAAKAGSAKESRISTRSKDPKKRRDNIRDSKKATENELSSQGQEDSEEDETLGGFIVGDDDIEDDEEEVLEEESGEEEEDEESDVD